MFDFLFMPVVCDEEKRMPQLSSALDFNCVSPGVHDAGRFLLRIIAFSNVVFFCLRPRLR